MRDIEYFRESYMNERNIRNFISSLPSNLRDMFYNNSLGSGSTGNVLQGYRGPYNNGDSGDSRYLGANNGLQEVIYWWGVSKHFHWVPVIGSIVFAISRDLGNTAWCSLYFDNKTGECLSHDKNQAAEKLNNKGCQLFREGKYAEAAEYYNNAYQACSSGYHNEQVFKNNINQAKDELEAISLNAQGDNLFNQGRYSEAQSKYQQAYNKSQVSEQYNEYTYNRDKAKAELEAMSLNSRGDNLFNQGRYSEAHSKYQEAYNESQVSTQYEKYRDNRDKAKVELEAMSLNSRGDNLFNQGRYSEAHSKYQEAYNESQVSTQYTKYSTNSQKAQIELDASNLNSLGDQLFKQGKYGEALDKYQSAYYKSQVTKEKSIYAISKDKVQTIIDKKLSMLDTLWNKAWDAENDTENDRSEEAKETFQTVLSESKDGLKTFPNNLRFKQYETLASVKIEGNELFNQGLESQQDGAKLLQEAHELKQRQKYELANIKFKEAQEKFKIGNAKDQRFASCIEFIQEQIKEVIQSIGFTEQHTLNLENLNINISNSNHLEADSREADIAGEYNNYYEQI